MAELTECQIKCGQKGSYYYRQGRWAILCCNEHAFNLKRTQRVFILPPRGKFRRLILEFGIMPLHGRGSVGI